MVVPNSGCTEEVLNLIKEKDKIEQKISQAGNILGSNNVRMNDPLIDNSGFPRSDIDVYQVRLARHEIICLQNDLKDVVKKIEKGLETIHSEVKTSKYVSLPIEDKASSANNSNFHMLPIAKVNFVSNGSPADIAGICLGDEILEFGSINFTNFKDLLQIGEIVRHRKDQSVKLRVRRINKIINLDLIPKMWSGRGLLGCNIVLIESVER